MSRVIRVSASRLKTLGERIIAPLCGVYQYAMHLSNDLKRCASFGMRMSWLSQYSGYSEADLWQAVREGLLPKPPGTKKAYYCHYDYFRAIDTEPKAYWLGFLYADGCVTDSGNVNLSITAKDAEHLEKYRRALQAEHPTESRTTVGGFKGYEDMAYATVKIRIFSPEMRDDLIRLGCPPRKSATLAFPSVEQVPIHLRRHFIRGYFDGDGSINVYHGRNGDIWQWALLSSAAFSRRCGEVLVEEAGVDQIDLKPHPTATGMAYLSHRRIANVNRLRDYLYEGATVWLDRKRVKHAEVPVKYHSNKRAEIVATVRDRMRAAGLMELTSFTLMDLYGLGKESAWWAMDRLRSKGIITLVARRDKTNIYRLT